LPSESGKRKIHSNVFRYGFIGHRKIGTFYQWPGVVPDSIYLVAVSFVSLSKLLITVLGVPAAADCDQEVFDKYVVHGKYKRL